MESLKELIKILNRKKISSLDVLDKTFLTRDASNIYLKLYKAIESGKVNTDKEAEIYIYGKQNNIAYRQLKSRFKKKFLKTLLLLDTDAYFLNNKVTKNYYECISVAYGIDILTKLTGITHTVIDIVKNEYPKVLQYKYYDILIKYSNYIIAYYSLKGEIKKVEEEAVKCQYYIAAYATDNECKALFNNVQAKFIAGKPVNQLLLNELKSTITHIESKVEGLEVPDVRYNLFQLKLNYEESTGNVESILKLTDELHLFFELHPQYLNNTKKVLILLYKLKSYLHLKEYDKGLYLLQKNAYYFPATYSYNWYAIKEFEFKLYLHNKQTGYAASVLNEVMATKPFVKQLNNLQEKWKILEAYYLFMENYLTKGNYKFSIAKFMNEVPIASKDKTGFNFAIRLIEILFLMGKNDYNTVFKRMDGLTVYKNRYLNDNSYKRNHLFLCLLLKAEKTGFNAADMRKLKAQELEELNKTNTYIIAEWEIIPFEHIWDIMLQIAKH